MKKGVGTRKSQSAATKANSFCSASQIRKQLLQELQMIECHSQTNRSASDLCRMSLDAQHAPQTHMGVGQAFSQLRLHQKQRNEGMHVRGFQEQIGVSDEMIARAFDVSLPRPWKGIGAIASIRACPGYPDERIPVFSAVSVIREGNGAHLGLYLNDTGSDHLLDNFFRACAHVNCWNSSNTLNQSVCDRLQKITFQRAFSYDRTPFPSAESCHSKTDIDRAIEYWTELLGLALRIDAESEDDWMRHFAHALHAYRTAASRLENERGISADIQAAVQIFSLLDSSFMPWHASHVRTATLRRAMDGAIVSRIEELMDWLPEDIRASFVIPLACIFDGGGNMDRERTYTEQSRDALPPDLLYALHSVDRIYHDFYRLHQAGGKIFSIRHHPIFIDLEQACEEIARACAPYDRDIHKRFAHVMQQAV